MANSGSEAGHGLRRVGELAAATGLTVRTLHHYEGVGILDPSARSDAGHRLYGPAAVERLYRISLLRELGLSLEEVGRALDDPAWDLRGALRRHLERVQQQAAQVAALRVHLTTALASLDATSPDPNTPDPIADDLIKILEDMAMLDSTLTQRISILVYQDLEAAQAELVHLFGFTPGEVTLDADGRAVHAELYAGDGEIWLHQESEEFGLASPRTLGAATATMAVLVDDVDAHHERAVGRGARILYGPVGQPYGYREYSARDTEGVLWSFMKPLR